ncbi:hypothetical protein H6F46_06895 [Limnothrix sp. FACHB-1083]|uniref:hypothetical protein n=1 Tax=unclassified Limnothrix TaxID=2632864 RepID=UPI0016806C5C|nr:MULTISPECIES: hypothetical protein [unclassified Limnothrix]MBD2160419.1 hypothetical protein [Limnothrix sp. FACHB-1083]MBD2191120.1 hypothetical protein [Limnothrix sp. FACHB-1088]
MATKKDPNIVPGDGVRIIAKFGTVMRKKPSGTGKEPYVAYIHVTQRVADALGLAPAKSSELERKGKGDRVYQAGVSKGSKSVKVDNPKEPGKFMSLPVPGNANIKQIADFLAPTKASRFSLGGRFYPCTGEEAEAAKEAVRSAAAQEAKKKKSGG